MQLKTKIATAIATASLLASSFAPLALADTNLQISGNGAFSTSNVTSNQTQTTSVVQDNTANVTNNVTTNANTGNNDASFNTGGNTTIATGNAGSTVDLSTRVNSNQATVSGCGTCTGNQTVNISGNGAYSLDTAHLTNTNTTSLFQTNNANINNNVNTNQNTGYNTGNFNTGGSTTIVTGHAVSDVTVNNAANTNVASIGGGTGGSNGSVNVTESGNGAFSRNDVTLTLNHVSTLVQDNIAQIRNRVDVRSDTGHNDAGFNTGGDVLVDTGNALDSVSIDNMANFNAASLDCGCLLNVNGKISGNGAYSLNDIRASLNNVSSDFQTNRMNQENDVRVSPTTGYNHSTFNTGPVLHDPVVVITGHAGSDISITNSGNKNVLGSLAGLELPDVSHVSFSFDLGQLLGYLHMHMI